MSKINLGRRRWCLAFALFAVGLAFPAGAGADELRYASSPTPSRIVLSPSENPATSQSFAWRTDSATATGQVEVTRPDGTPVGTANATPGPVVSFPFAGETWTAPYSSRHHEATITGLTPDTAYRYRVGGAAGWSPWYEFRTAAQGATPWRMLYFGDVQTDILDYSEVVMDRSYAAVPDARLSLHAGDMINDSEQDYQWGEWFEILEGHSQRIVTPTIMGNHELHGDPDALQYHQHFNHPRNGPDGYKESAYHFDYQGVRFLILNSNKNWAPDQTDYVKSVLSTNPHKWTVVSFHHPVFSSSWNDRDNKSVRDSWMPLLEQYNVDLVLQGHDHIYSRGHLASNQISEGVQGGPVYTISMAGKKQYPRPVPGSGIDNWTPNGGVEVTSQEHLATYQDIEFDGDYLRYNAVVAAHGPVFRRDVKVGDSIDSFTVIKKDGETKRVVEGLQYAPKVPAPKPGKLRAVQVKPVGKTGAVRVRANVTAPGRVIAQARIKAGKRTLVAKRNLKVNRAGRVNVVLKPGKAGLRAIKKLRRKQRVVTQVTVTYRQAGAKDQRVKRRAAFRR